MTGAKDFADLDEAVMRSEVLEPQVEEEVKRLKEDLHLDPLHEIAWLLKAVSLIDLTTLAGDDTASNVKRLCTKAVRPLSHDLIRLTVEKNKDFQEGNDTDDIRSWLTYGVTTAAVCVYPSRVSDAVEHLAKLPICLPVASVATGFPSGQYPLCSRLAEIKEAVAQGASEIDVVLDRSLVLCGDWGRLYDELVAMRAACGEGVVLKTILATGELGSLSAVYRASMVAMAAGSDFIKTSTGKEAVNATLPVGLVMCRAIANYHRLTGRKVGLKPAGGLRTARDALEWLSLVRRQLGPDWLQPALFRIGASSLLQSLEKRLQELVAPSSLKPEDPLLSSSSLPDKY